MEKVLAGSRLFLGQSVNYVDCYDANLLYPIARDQQRQLLGLSGQPLPFDGADRWCAYELSWLNPRGKPEVRIGVFDFDAASTHMIESKAFKLYLNSLNQTRFDDEQALVRCVTDDLEQICGSTVCLHCFTEVDWAQQIQLELLPGDCLDRLDVTIDRYQPDPSLLKFTDAAIYVEEQLYSHLLKTNCPVTGQPDWATVLFTYHGPQIEHASLLKYLVGYRQHCGFHESCIEQIFMDIVRFSPSIKLMVQGCFTRRGGLDISPWRTNQSSFKPFVGRVFRQ